jgi:predicted esterase|tara:strand:+ start:77 stop:352 length:276 start_codon:yes stop_codon:yes gene_type:complete
MRVTEESIERAAEAAQIVLTPDEITAETKAQNAEQYICPNTGCGCSGCDHDHAHEWSKQCLEDCQDFAAQFPDDDDEPGSPVVRCVSVEEH